MILSDLGTEFLGRDNELNALKSIAEEARDGNAQSVLLFGKRGVGKTVVLNHLFQHLFTEQIKAVPFLYSVKSARISIEQFSADYLCRFIIQYIAFHLKDQMIMQKGACSLDDLRIMASDESIQWAVDVIDDFSRLKDENNPMKLFSFAISSPYQSYLSTGMPVVTIIDDFHKIKKMCELGNNGDKIDFWILYENYLRSFHTPHILAGYHGDLQKMFFEETAIGDHLDVFRLSGLSQSDSQKLFSRLCRRYTLRFDPQMIDCIDLFEGNPFYIKSFVQAARRINKTISNEEFWEIYVNEVTRGKIYTYWTSLLKIHVSDFEMRRPSLNFLHILFDKPSDVVVSKMSKVLSIEKEELDEIINQLHNSGAVDMGFSTLDLADDAVLVDIITGLYQKEIKKESPDKIREVIIGKRLHRVEIEALPTFDVKIPSAPKTELVAVKSLEQIARHYKIPVDITGNLQVALIELFSGILTESSFAGEHFYLRFTMQEDTFFIEVETRRPVIDITGFDREQVLKMMRSHLDDVKVEKTTSGTKIVMMKKMKGEALAAK